MEDKTIIEEKQGEVLNNKDFTPGKKKMYVESYGCAMNFADTEVVASVMNKEGYEPTDNMEEADVVFLNTCSIRENAETTVRKRLELINSKKRLNPKMKVGVLGCMAERLKGKLLDEEKLVDIVAGPDSYRNLPGMITEVIDGDKSVNVLLSREETYSDIDPVRLNSNGISSFVSIMRGCDNMCTFCVVPFTRGRERSRDPESILKEVQKLVDNGYKEVTLLGQNVDSYRWSSDSSLMGKALKEAPRDKVVDFAKLLELVALVDPLLRVRFSTSHPKDISDDVIEMIAKYNNICNHIHLPVQSGSSRVLKMMNRTYTREWYLDKVAKIRSKIPNCAITTDIITGFCSETEEEHQETLSLIEACEFDMAFMYFYSERPGTLAAKKFKDDVSLADKKRRLSEVIETQHRYNLKNNLACVDQVFEVLVESVSKKSDNDLSGRTSEGKVVVFPKQNWKIGDYVKVKINKCTHATLIGEAI